jgi:hypothetical protein
MKNFILGIVFTLSIFLCGSIVYDWVTEEEQQKEKILDCLECMRIGKMNCEKEIQE